MVGHDGMRNMAVNNLITGVALALVGAGLASAYGHTHGMAWVAPIVGIWTIITPWVIRGKPAGIYADTQMDIYVSPLRQP